VAGRYEKRTLSGSGLGSVGSTPPIRHAEVRILNSSGVVLQCGALSGSGIAALAVPASTSNYTIRIFARANNSSVNASVLDCPEENNVHFLDQTFLPDTSKTVTVTATAAEPDVKAGAFNILDQIAAANDFLRTEVGTCSFTGCTAFTVAPKVSTYWVKGFNPNVYQGDSFNGISFYLPGFRRMFIMGGVAGDVQASDTDHFDDPVVIHEYGHFLEDVYSISDSPGGAHSGNAAIDPRLAWSEGWANFFQGRSRARPCTGTLLGMRTVRQECY